MKHLPEPKEAKTANSIWDQLKMGLCCYFLGLVFTSFTGSPVFQYLGHLIYWGIFLVKPAVPWNIADDPVKTKKFKLFMRIASGFIILYPLNQLFDLTK